jgi:hypothetical protein
VGKTRKNGLSLKSKNFITFIIEKNIMQMQTRVIILFLIIFLFGTETLAQLSKKEKKEWKKKAKEFAKNPDNLKALIDQKQTADNTVTALKGDVAKFQTSLTEKDSKIGDQLNKTRGELTAAKAELAQKKENPPPPNPLDFSKGLVFKVQIGAFKNKNLAKYFENNPNFGGEVREGEPQKVTIGIFRDYWQADTFKKYLREMGVKDAWIVPYKDAVRVEIKDVLEGVISDKPKAAN